MRLFMYLHMIEDTQPLNALLTVTLGGDTLSYSCEAVSRLRRKMDSEGWVQMDCQSFELTL